MHFKRFSEILLVAFALGFVVMANAKGAIVNGIDTFDGSSIDTSTYNIINQEDQTSLVQDDALIFSIPAQPHVTGVVTLFPAVGVGGGAQIQFAIGNFLTGGQAAYIGLALATDDGGSWYLFDSYTVFSEMNLGFGSFYAGYDTTGNYGDANGGAIPAGAEESCIMRVERLSSTLIQGSLLTDSGELLAQYDQTCVADSDLLKVEIAAQGLNVTVDNLELFGNYVPEPGAFGIVASLMLISFFSVRMKPAM